MTGPDEDRVVDLSDDGLLPESTRDDPHAGWDMTPPASADWLREEHPPHWE